MTDVPGAIDASAGSSAEVRLQFRAAGSRTVTFVSVVLPTFVTVILNFALPPTGTDCVAGFFTIATAGAGSGVTVSGSQAPVAAG